MSAVDLSQWTPVAEQLPTNGQKVEVITPGGDQRTRTLIYDQRLWWLPDMSMYCYFTPTFWRPSPATTNPPPPRCGAARVGAVREGEGEAVTLAEFLLARIGEDEDKARRTRYGAADRPWVLILPPRVRALNGDFPPDHLLVNGRRVLAECEAKRKLVAWHTDRDECCEERLGPMVFDAEPTVSVGTDSWGGLVTRRLIGHQERIGCVTLMLLAEPYADHPAYREEWAG